MFSGSCVFCLGHYLPYRLFCRHLIVSGGGRGGALHRGGDVPRTDQGGTAHNDHRHGGIVIDPA